MPYVQQRGAGMRRNLRLPRGVVLAPLIFIAIAHSSDAQEAAQFFRQNCASCHTIGGGRLTGPDLKDVTARKDREWLKQFILDPQGRINAGDPYALQLLEEARGVVMPKIAGITPDRADFLLDLIESESALPESQFKGMQISNEPFTPADVERGRLLFSGRQRLAGNAPACISCHTIPGLGGLGGGKLGPDLTRVYERLQGRTALSAWLQAPALPTMQALLQNQPLAPEEIHALVALFEDAAKNGQTGYQVAQMNFTLMGFGGAILLLVLFDFIWKGRFRSVRRALVRARRI